MKNPTGPAWPVAIALAASLALLLPVAVRAQATTSAAAASPAGAAGEVAPVALHGVAQALGVERQVMRLGL